MKVLWSRRTSHLFDPPWINNQGREIQTTFCDHFNISSIGRKGGRQFFPRRLAHPRREVVRNFGSEALCKASIGRLKEESESLPFTVQISILVFWRPKVLLVGRRDPKWILDRFLSQSVPHRGKMKFQGSS